MAKILYLEDEPTIREITVEYIRSRNHDVTDVDHGDLALEYIKTNSYDLIILDIMVPGVSGLDILAHLSKDNYSGATIIMSALGDEQTQLKAFNLLADDYIIKPFSPLLLLKRIDAILRRTNQTIENHSGLFIDSNSYQAYFDNQSLNLTLTEFLIIKRLYSSPNQVFTRENLLEYIFPNDYFANDRVIDAHIKNLRKKLPIQCIKTVNGVGYKFEDVS